MVLMQSKKVELMEVYVFLLLIMILIFFKLKT